MTVNLKPCPFCNGKPETRESKYLNYIKCSSCEIVLSSDGTIESIEDTIKKWNRRVKTK